MKHLLIIGALVLGVGVSPAVAQADPPTLCDQRIKRLGPALGVGLSAGGVGLGAFLGLAAVPAPSAPTTRNDRLLAATGITVAVASVGGLIASAVILRKKKRRLRQQRERCALQARARGY